METRIRDGDPQTGRGRSFRLVIPPDPRYGSLVRRRIAEFGRANTVPELDMYELLTAVGEALANAFEHACASKKIEVACWLVGSDQIIATVVDAGTGIGDSIRVGDVPLPEPDAERGRGFAIMRRCTDHLAIRTTPGKGTAVVMVRFIRGRRPDAAWEHAWTG